MKKPELGLDTFGDVTVDADCSLMPQPRVIRNVVDEAVLTDELYGTKVVPLVRKSLDQAESVKG